MARTRTKIVALLATALGLLAVAAAAGVLTPSVGAVLLGSHVVLGASWLGPG